MASRGLGTLTLDLVAKTGGFEAGMDRAARHADKRMRDIENRANKFGKVIGTALAAGAAAALTGVIAVTKQAIDAADRINDISQRLGVGTEALSAWGYAAQQSGTDLEALNGGLTRFTKNVAAAMDSGSRQGEIFEALGISVKDAAGNLRSVEELVPEVASAFKDLNNATLEAALAQELFGKSGAQLLQFLNLGGEGLADMEQRARDLGIVISQETATAADDFNDSLADLKAIASGLGLQLAQELLPALIDLIAQFKAAIQEGGAVAKIVEFIGDQASAAVSDLQFFGQTFEDIGHIWDAITLKGQAMKELLSFNLAEAQRLNAAGAAAFAAGTDGAPDSAGRRTTPIPDLRVPGLSPLFGSPAFSAVPLAGLGAPLQSRSTESALGRVFTNAPTPNRSGGGSGRSRGSDALKEQARDAEKAREELARLVEQEAQAREAFESMAASLAGPLADANYQYIQDQQRLNELAKEGAIGATDLRIAQENLTAAHEKNVEAINAQLTPSQEVVAALQEELLMLGMTNEQQEIYNNLKYAEVDANTAAGQSIVQMTEQLQKAREARAIVDDLKGATKDFFVDLTDDVGTAREAWDDFFDGIKRRAMEFVADKAINALFDMLSGNGGSGSTGVMNPITGGMVSGGGGSSGAGFWASLIGAFMGGGKAGGGTVMPGGLYPVNERGTEMLSIGGKDYLMMGSQAGRITPNHKLSSGGQPFTQNLNVTIAGRPDRRTPDQIARAAGREARQQMARTG